MRSVIESVARAASGFDTIASTTNDLPRRSVASHPSVRTPDSEPPLYQTSGHTDGSSPMPTVSLDRTFGRSPDRAAFFASCCKPANALQMSRGDANHSIWSMKRGSLEYAVPMSLMGRGSTERARNDARWSWGSARYRSPRPLA
jgi:hypothetical protein